MSTCPGLRLHRGTTCHTCLSLQKERIDEFGPEDALMRMIYETEVERVLYLLRSYLRTRLQKIQATAVFLAGIADP